MSPSQKQEDYNIGLQPTCQTEPPELAHSNDNLESLVNGIITRIGQEASLQGAKKTSRTFELTLTGIEARMIMLFMTRL